MTRNLFAILAFASVLLIPGSCVEKKQDSGTSNLTCELCTNPLGIDNPAPRLSWILTDTSRGTAQAAYQIIIAGSPGRLTEKKADIWNSGKVESASSTLVPYAGPELKPATPYFWKVRIWDTRGRDHGYSDAASWETGLFSLSDWKADWIGFDPKEVAGNLVSGDTARLRSILLRKEFNIVHNIRKARVYISGLGSYVFYLNGAKVGDDYFRPGWTDYRKRVQYQVYDVTELLRKGDNAAGIMLGNMWWTSGLGWNGSTTYSDGPLRAIMQLRVEYTNGKKEIFGTDESWKGQLSPVTENSLYHGETWDARLAIPMWSEPGLQDEKWFSVKTLPMNGIALSAAIGPPIQANEEIKPVSVREVTPGVYVYDFGTNLVGMERLRVSGDNGDTVVLKFAELLHDDGTVAQENLRTARATDRYILRGDSTEIWSPSFTYHGFRYIQAQGLPGTPGKENLTALRLYSSAPVTGHFSSSNVLLNKIWQNVLNGQEGNMMSVPTDCPQRDERLGWMGDAQIFAPTACYNMNMLRFFEKWMRDITDSQDSSGYVYDVNPAIVVEGPAKAGWGDAVTVVPWVVYNFYGDEQILRNNYDGMKAWVEYMKRKSRDHVYRWSEKAGEWEGYGDWVSVVKSPVGPISDAYYYYSSKILSQAAGVLGKNEDQKYYALLADTISSGFQKKFFDPHKRDYPEGTQTANLIPLAFGITPDSLRQVIAGNISKNVISEGYHPTTGFLGTPLLLPVLSEYGFNDAAYRTATGEEYPSWGYMVNKGSTTMWELWNSDTEPPGEMNSRNHFALGSVAEWYYGYLAGIRPAEPGFRKAIIAPLPPAGLDHVEGSIYTLYGTLSDEWTRTDDSFSMTVMVPANTTALVKIPQLFPEGYSLTESGRVLIKNGEKGSPDEFITIGKSDSNAISLNVAAGKYSFILTKTRL